ncbi:MAG: SPFH domain-containing protein [Aquihabitans sp.]
MTDPQNPDQPVEDQLGDDAPLGAAATLSGRLGKPTRSAEGTSPRERRRRLRPGFGVGAVVIGALLFALVPLVGSSLKKTPRDRIGISYGGGPIEGSKFQKIVSPGHTLFFNGFFDPLYLYPDDQRNYIISKSPSQGSPTPDSVVAPSKDRVQIEYQVAVYYKLNTDRLQAFHEQLGLKYNAFTSKGWDALIRDTFRQQIENALQEETRRYDVSGIYGNADVLVKIQDAVQATLSVRLKAALGQAFFCSPQFERGQKCEDPTFIIKRADIPKSVAVAYEQVRVSEVNIATRKNEILQREVEAKGIQAINTALQEGGQAYVLLKAIESGKINFWVLPSDGGVSLTTPNGASPPTPAAGGK